MNLIITSYRTSTVDFSTNPFLVKCCCSMKIELPHKYSLHRIENFVKKNESERRKVKKITVHIL